MVFSWRWLLILSALVLGGGQGFAAGTREARDYTAAAGSFQAGLWGRAETQFAQFVDRFPDSTNTPMAVLLEAQAQFKQGKLTNSIVLLTSAKAQAGGLADQYAYWIGEAQFQHDDFSGAAATFMALAHDYPTSLLRVRAVVEASSAQMRLKAWDAVENLLQETNGVFQHAAQLDQGNELVSRGRLLLAQAKFAKNNFPGARAVLELLKSQPLPADLDWQRAYLLCQVNLAENDLNGALAAAMNLTQIAKLGKDAGWRAESAALRGEALEKLGRLEEASAAYQENLAPETPEIRQRQAILEVAELAIVQKNFSEAGQRLEKFLTQFPDSPALDIALLTLGELRLRDYVAQPAADTLVQARTDFDRFIAKFPDSPLIGKVHLDRGWTYWFEQNYLASAGEFNLAVQNLPLSEDLAVARFKLGDALYAQRNFSGALGNYREVLENFKDFPAVSELGDRALYQSLRAQLATGNLTGASNVMARIAATYPASALAQNGALLLGESLGDSQQPYAARELFQQFATRFAGSPLEPQVALAVARTYERERDWPNAIRQYSDWLARFATNSLQPQVDYALAWANFQVGNETNALGMFTEFVTQFPTNDLSPLAQWWVADHFYRAGDFLNAEKNYKHVFEKWPAASLCYEARMMAGRAAMGRTGYASAIHDYFSKLEDDTNCPMELRVQATFAHGDALMYSDSSETNRPLVNFELAADVFDQICQRFPNNEWGALAWGEKARCYQQLGAQDAAFFDRATNAYAQVFNTNSPANAAARCQAQIGFGMVLEKKAALVTGADKTALLKLALNNYLDVFETSLDPGATDYSVKKAGLQALPLITLPGMGVDEAAGNNFIDRMEKLLPPLKKSLEEERAKLTAQKN